MQTNIPNRYGTESLTVSTMSETSGGPCISISAMAGQLSFYHFMTPEQARQMASALTTAAQCIEVQVPKIDPKAGSHVVHAMWETEL